MSTTQIPQQPPAGGEPAADAPARPRPAGGGRLRVALRDRRLRTGAAYVALVAAIGWLYGILPPTGRTFPLPVVASMQGWVACLEDGLVPCTYVGYPNGVDLSIGLPLVGGTFLLTRLGLDVETAVNLLAMSALAVGFAALWALAASIVRSTVAGAVAACLYYLSTAVVSHTGKTALWLGFLLLPVPLAITWFALSTRRRRAARSAILVADACAVALLLVYLDPYAWAIAVVLCAPIALLAAVRSGASRAWGGSALAACLLVALVVPGIVFRHFEPSAEGSTGFDPDVYRTFGVDVVTAVTPTSDSLLGDLVGSPFAAWDRDDFYGDGTHLAGAFLGAVTLVAAIAGAVLLLRRSGRHRAAVAALVAAALACLALGLGPSFKFLDEARPPTPADRYLMPESAATAPTGWDWVYGIQPFEGMRATYRWHLGLRVVLVLLAAAAVAAALRRHRAIGAALIAVLLLETASHTLLDARGTARDNHAAARALAEDMDLAFGGGRLEAEERVLFLPSSNDYLIMAIAPPRRLDAYNTLFDKEVVRLRALTAPAVRTAVDAEANGTLTTAEVCALFRQDLVDAVVFTDFDMRWDSDSWPPSERRQRELRARVEDLGIVGDPNFAVDEGHMSVVVRRAPGGGC